MIVRIISMSRIFQSTVLVLIAVFCLALAGCDEKDNSSNRTTVRIGGLFSLTGNWSTLGMTSNAAMKLAIEDVNNHYKDNSEGIVFSDVVVDTKLEPEIALQELQKFEEADIMYVIGPMSSSEVAMVKDYADQNNIFILSQGSTAGSLSIPGDNIFRFAPDDMLEGKAIVTLMQKDNLTHIVPVWRNDSGNSGLESSMRTIFTSEGGIVSEGVSYNSVNPDFQTVINSLEQQVTDTVADSGMNSVGIYLAGFDEVVDLFVLAKNSEILSSVKWYGSDGVVFSEALLQNTGGSSEFAESVFYLNPIFGINPALEDRWKPVADKIFASTGLEPDAFALSVYDAVWVIAMAYFNAGSPEDIDSFKQSFVDIAAEYQGITGSTELNAAGDRKIADFDFWGVRSHVSGFIWQKLGMFDFDSDTVTGF